MTPLEGTLKDISLTSKSVTSVPEDTVEIEKFEDEEKQSLEEKLLASAMGKKLEKMLASIQSESTAETRRDKLVALMDDFFEVGSSTDKNLVQRLVVNEKTYMRFAMGWALFDVEVSDALMPSLVDWYIEIVTTLVNEWIEEEEKQVALTYEKQEEFIVKTQKELRTLKKAVRRWSSGASDALWATQITRDQVEEIKKEHGFWSLKTLKAYWLYVVSWLRWLIWMTSAAGKLSKTMMAQKNEVKAAESEKKWYEVWDTLKKFQATLASAFGVWWTTPSETPSNFTETPSTPPASPAMWGEWETQVG